MDEILEAVWRLYLNACVCHLDHGSPCHCEASTDAGEILRKHLGDDWHEICRTRWPSSG